MKNTFFIFNLIILVLGSSLVYADTKAPLDRKALCIQACGVPSSTVIEIKSSKKALGKSIHVDCKCGSSGFNPINGALCRDGHILTEFDRFCLDSHGTILNEEAPKTSPGKMKVFSLHKCVCDDKSIEKPSLTTFCENGNIISKEHVSPTSCSAR